MHAGGKAGTRLPQKGDAVGLGVQGCRKAADAGKARQGKQQAHLSLHAKKRGAVQQGKAQHKLARKSVKRRQAGNGRRTYGKGRAKEGQTFLQPAQMLHAHGSCGVQHFACAQEQQPLECRVVEHVQQRAGKSQYSNPRIAAALANEPCTQPHDHQAHVFHAGIGEQPFEVALGRGL